jgi:dihydropteroate synthase
MLRDIYIRPIGLYPARQTDASDAVWDSLRLAGGWLDFTALEAIERNGARIERRIVGLGGFMERDWGRRTLAAADLFEALRQPRPRVKGLALDAPRIMGIVNVTPDSFSDGGRHADAAAAIAHAKALIAAGADIVDIGGESTRPGAAPTPLEVELQRVIPVIEAIAGRTEALISVDTRKAAVMRAAAAAGADLINDVSALTFEPQSLEAAAASGLPVILMHAQGDPRTMQEAPAYGDVVLDVFDFLEDRIDACRRAGIARDKLIADPGIGFGKSLAHNLALLGALGVFHGLGVPLLVGASRKAFIGALSGVTAPAERLPGSIAAALAAVAQGVQIVRVHDVAETRQALRVHLAACAGSCGALR